MNLSLNAVDIVRSLPGLNPTAYKTEVVSGTGFKDAMLQALQATSDLQAESGRLSKEFTLGNPTVSLEETMMAGAKAGIAFQATLQVRNKIVQAYTDIMNMQV